MNPIRLILAAPIRSTTTDNINMTIVRVKNGAAAMMACIVVGGLE